MLDQTRALTGRPFCDHLHYVSDQSSKRTSCFNKWTWIGGLAVSSFIDAMSIPSVTFLCFIQLIPVVCSPAEDGFNPTLLIIFSKWLHPQSARVLQHLTSSTVSDIATSFNTASSKCSISVTHSTCDAYFPNISLITLQTTSYLFDWWRATTRSYFTQPRQV